ncbi:MAG TPA: glycosyltransferase family 9 protein [Thermomicrobiales bacterium]|nr:glycosyltransferase family 9 protein [Thermomicrobiales bacterium]
MSEVAPRRIAVFRALFLGDMLLSVPALRSLRRRYPAAEITLIGLPWAASFAERFGHLVDRFLPFPGFPGIDEVAYDEQRTTAFMTEQRDYRYDVVIQMHGSGRTSNPFAAALGGKVTVGYYVGDPPVGLDRAICYPDLAHEIGRNLWLAELAGGSAADRALEFPVSDADRYEADALTGPPSLRPLIVIHPGSKLPTRRWMPERFAAVADAVVERFGAEVVVTGTDGEAAVADAVVSSMRHRAASLAGRTTLGSLAAIVERSRLFITNDTGTAHLAVALRTPSVVLFGPGDVRRWGPLDRERHRVVQVPTACSPCEHAYCPIDHRCLRAIEPEQVLAEVSRVLVGHLDDWQLWPETEMRAPCAG